VIQALSQF